MNDASQPTACVLCGAGKAGVGGTCQDCDAGTAPSSALTTCDLCAVGHFSPAGVSCDACADNVDGSGNANGRFTSDLVNCEVCADGTRPTSDHASCQPCAIGTAGVRGTCEMWVNEVVDGVTIGKHSPDRIVCTACADGKEPNVLHTACNVCPAGPAGVAGRCHLFVPASPPSSTLTQRRRCYDPPASATACASRWGPAGPSGVALCAAGPADAPASEASP